MALGDVYEKTGSSTWTKRATIVGSPGPAGATGATGQAEAWHSGSGVPSSGLGADGDWYLDSGGASPWNPPTLVTSLPSSPADGQEVFYVADGSQGVLWHLRYRSGASGSFKWEFVGGSELFSVVTGVQAQIAQTPTLITGLSLTLPLAGDYYVWYRFWASGTVATALLYTILRHNGVQVVGSVGQPPGVNYMSAGPHGARTRMNGAAASATIDAQGWCNSGWVTFGDSVFGQRGELSVLPIRLG